MWARMGPRNYVLDGSRYTLWEGAILRGKRRPVVKYRDALPLSCEKTAEAIQMPSGLMIRVDPKNCVLDGGPDSPMQRSDFRGKVMPGHARRHSAVSCAKMAEPIEMPFEI